MAVDTRDKRASVLSHTVQNLGRPWPLPNGSNLATAGERQAMAFLYSGITAASPGTAVYSGRGVGRGILRGVMR